tara:strand:+ start:11227 stop:11808 length:582 start_codon:yes stop_codon:yes gene_type:complete
MGKALRRSLATANLKKFGRLQKFVDGNWRHSRAGDYGIALWNKGVKDCVFVFEVCEVVDSSHIRVRFVDDGKVMTIVPKHMPIVTAGDGDVIAKINALCKELWPNNFDDSGEDSGGEMVEVSDDDPKEQYDLNFNSVSELKSELTDVFDKLLRMCDRIESDVSSLAEHTTSSTSGNHHHQLDVLYHAAKKYLV